MLFDTLNKKVSIDDNMLADSKIFNVTVDANGDPTSKTTITTSLTNKIKGLSVLNAKNLTNTNIFPIGGIFISFEQQTATILINNITGLQAGQTYQLTVVAFG